MGSSQAEQTRSLVFGSFRPLIKVILRCARLAVRHPAAYLVPATTLTLTHNHSLQASLLFQRLFHVFDDREEPGFIADLAHSEIAIAVSTAFAS